MGRHTAPLDSPVSWDTVLKTQKLRIHTRIHIQYQVFDRSGQLPFHIIFGLCRRSPTDTDPRPLLLQTECSVLDVEYALRNTLLKLYEHSGDEQHWTEIDVAATGLKNTGVAAEPFLVLPSPVNRRQSKFEAFTVYRYLIGSNSELASFLKPGRKYSLRLASADLGVRWCAYGETNQLLDQERHALQSSVDIQLVNSKPSAEHATFKVVQSLPWPPRITTHLRRRSPAPVLTDCQEHDRSVTLEISVANTGDRAVSVQCRGRQRFLVPPWGPFQPEQPTDDPRPQIIDSSDSACFSNLIVADTRSGVVVHKVRPPSCSLYDTAVDHRPKLAGLVTLRPGKRIIRSVNIEKLLRGLPDGQYDIGIQSRSAWWCSGPLEAKADGCDERVPKKLYNTAVPPVMLDSEDTVGVCIEDGYTLGGDDKSL